MKPFARELFGSSALQSSKIPNLEAMKVQNRTHTSNWNWCTQYEIDFLPLFFERLRIHRSILSGSGLSCRCHAPSVLRPIFWSRARTSADDFICPNPSSHCTTWKPSERLKFRTGRSVLPLAGSVVEIPVRFSRNRCAVLEYSEQYASGWATWQSDAWQILDRIR